MATKFPELSSLFKSLSETSKRQVLRLADISNDRPPVLRGEGGYVNEGNEWVDRHADRLGTVAARFLPLSDEAATELFGDEIERLSFARPGKRATLVFRPHELDVERTDGGEETPLQLTVAASAVFFQLYADIQGAARRIESPPPPSVSVRRGSVQFSFGSGALLLSGISLVVAAAPTLVGSPFATIGGLALVTFGLVDQAINWRRTLVDTRAAKATLSKTELERKKLELEIEEKTLELQRLRLGMLSRQEPTSNEKVEEEIAFARRQLEALEEPDVPASGVVPQALITETARLEGVSVGLANHLVNRALPAFSATRIYFQGIDLVQGQDSGGRPAGSTAPKGGRRKFRLD